MLMILSGVEALVGSSDQEYRHRRHALDPVIREGPVCDSYQLEVKMLRSEVDCLQAS